MTDIALNYREILKGGVAAHITRAQVTPTRPKALHTQDFHELFWVQNGHIRHHLPDGVASLSEGALVFAQAGQSHAHVSRTMKRVTGIRPSDFINEKRMTHAARQLTGTSETLQDIATDCGIPNLSHFHKLFRTTYKLTPHAYRRKFQRHVVQPE